MSNNHRDDARGASKLRGIRSTVAPTPRTPPSQSGNPRIAPAHVAQRQSIKTAPMPALAKRGAVGNLAVRAAPTNPNTNRHAPLTVQPKVAPPRAKPHQSVRMAGMNPQTPAVQQHLKPGAAQARPGMASPSLSKCGCRGAHPTPCNCHGGSWPKTLQLAKGKKKAKAKTAAWLKTWRNIQCYAQDTANAMDRRMNLVQIEEYLKAFLKEHSEGVRGHCSEGGTADAEPSGHTKEDLVIFHSYHRANKPW